MVFLPLTRSSQQKRHPRGVPFLLAGLGGVEPPRRESKSRVLPLDYSPIYQPHSGGRLLHNRDTRKQVSLYLWGGRWDSNPRSSVPQTDALGQLRYTHHIGAPEGTRTPGPLLRRQVLYPAELQARIRCPPGRFHLERVMGIEPTQPAWKAGVLPLNYTRICCLQRDL